MSQKPTYFLTPPRPYPPTGPIRLGAIIPSPTQPDEPLHSPALPKPEDVSTFTEKNWTGSHMRKSSSRFGVWTSFLQMIFSIGGDVSMKIDKEVNQHWDIERMCTMSFMPSQTFIEDCVKCEEVRRYIIGNRFREKIYMVTGVMIASSTTTFRESLEEKGVYVHAGVDATAWAGVPISVGPEGKWKRKQVTKTGSEREEEFVFAFRVREIRVKRKGGVKTHKLYDKGALFNTDQKLEEVVLEDEVEVEGLGEEADGEEFGLESKESKQILGDMDEQEEDCICVLPEE